MPVTLQISEVPESVRDVLAGEAERQNQSLQGFLLDLVTREARIQKNRAIFEQTADARIPLSGEWSPEAIIRQGRDAGFEVDRTV